MDLVLRVKAALAVVNEEDALEVQVRIVLETMGLALKASLRMVKIEIQGLQERPLAVPDHNPMTIDIVINKGNLVVAVDVY
jgi:hypothetical protein